MIYNNTLFLFFLGGEGGGMKHESEIKDENEASYFYVQGVP